MAADPVKISRTLRVGGGEIVRSPPLIVGIVNATPDSFSDSGERTPAAWIRNALACYEAGAAIVEGGGESNLSNPPAGAGAGEDRAGRAGDRRARRRGRGGHDRHPSGRDRPSR